MVAAMHKIRAQAQHRLVPLFMKSA